MAFARTMLPSLLVLSLCATMPRAATYPAWIPQGLADLPQGTPARGADTVSDITIGGADRHLSTTSYLDVSGQPFTRAVRIEVSQTATTPWSILIRLRAPFAVDSGDVLALVFWARGDAPAEETTEGRVGVIAELGQSPYTKSLALDVAPYGVWKQYAFPFVAKNTMAADGMSYGFNLGYRAQNVELGGIELINFGTSVTVEQLAPFKTKASYAGIDPNAPWRAAAAARIDSLRRADLTLQLVDNSQPVSGVSVRVAMQRHRFGFGTALSTWRFFEADSTAYRRHLVQNFNKAATENWLKWKQWNDYRLSKAQEAIAWLAERTISTRGHVLVWPGWKRMPDWVNKTDAGALETQIEEHITEAVTAMRGKIPEWDVINEPFANHDAMDLIGNEAMITWFHTARAHDSSVALYINDYGILAGNNTEHHDHYYNTIEFLIDGGAPLQGIGMQGHFGSNPTPPTELIRRLDRFAVFGKDIQITEFDVNTTDEQLQADYTRDFYTAVFSHPAVTGILMWGFWEGQHWKPDAAMYRQDWSPKPNLHAYRDLVFGTWWTDQTLRTNAEGRAALRGFKGDYTITVTTDAGEKSCMLSLVNDTSLLIDIDSGMVPSIEPSRGSAPHDGQGPVVRHARGARLGVDGLRGEHWEARIYTTGGRLTARSGRLTAGESFTLNDMVPGLYVTSIRTSSGNSWYGRLNIAE